MIEIVRYRCPLFFSITISDTSILSTKSAAFEGRIWYPFMFHAGDLLIKRFPQTGNELVEWSKLALRKGKKDIGWLQKEGKRTLEVADV